MGVVFAFILRVIVTFVIAIVCGFLFMLAVGIVHHEWITQCPTIGYWWAVLITGLLRMTFVSTSSTDDE